MSEANEFQVERVQLAFLAHAAAARAADADSAATTGSGLQIGLHCKKYPYIRASLFGRFTDTTYRLWNRFR